MVPSDAINNKYRRILQKHGLVISGEYAKKRLGEIVEIPDHPWFAATQFHPEFKSRPLRPHPLFRDFVKAAMKASGFVAQAFARNRIEGASMAP